MARWLAFFGTSAVFGKSWKPRKSKIFGKFNLGDPFTSLAKRFCETLALTLFFRRGGFWGLEGESSGSWPARVGESKTDQILLFAMIAAALQRIFLVLPGKSETLTKFRKKCENKQIWYLWSLGSPILFTVFKGEPDLRHHTTRVIGQKKASVSLYRKSLRFC